MRIAIYILLFSCFACSVVTNEITKTNTIMTERVIHDTILNFNDEFFDNLLRSDIKAWLSDIDSLQNVIKNMKPVTRYVLKDNSIIVKILYDKISVLQIKNSILRTKLFMKHEPKMVLEYSNGWSMWNVVLFIVSILIGIYFGKLIFTKK